MSDSRVQVTFGADASNLEAGAQKAASALDGLGSAVYKSMQGGTEAGKGLGESFKALGAQIASVTAGVGSSMLAMAGVMATAATAAGAAVGTIAATAVNFGVDVGATAAQLGDTTENVAALAPVAAAAGMSLDDFSKKFTALREKLRTGDDDVEKALEALKIDVDDFKALSASAQVDALNTALSNLGDSYTKTAAMTKLFGDDTQKMLGVLNMAPEDFIKLRTEAERTGTVLSGPMIEGMKGTQNLVGRVSRNFQEARDAVSGLAITIYGQLKPAIDDILQGFAATVETIARWVEGINDATKKGAGLAGVVGHIRDALFTLSVQTKTFVNEFSASMTLVDTLLRTTFDNFGTIADHAWGEIKAGAVALWAALGDGFLTLFEKIKTMAMDAGRHFWDSFTKAQPGEKIKNPYGSLELPAPQDESAGLNTDKTYLQVTRQMHDNIDKFTESYKAEIAKSSKETAAAWSKPITMPAKPGANAGTLDKDDDKSGQDELQKQQKIYQAELDALKSKEQQTEQLLTAGVAMHQLTEGQKVAATASSLGEEYAAEMAIFEKWKALEGLKPQVVQEVFNRQQKATEAYTKAIQGLNLQAAEQTAKQWDSAMTTINSSITGQINGLMRGTATWAQAFKNVLSSLIIDVIKFCAEWALKQAETVAMNMLGINAETHAAIAGAAAQSGASQSAGMASVAANTGAIMSSIMKSAGEAFAGVFGFLAPVMGPAAAGPAAAAQSTVMAARTFASGSWQLPSDMLAQVHQGEMIVPAAQTPWAQSLMSNAAGGGNGSGGVTVNHATHFNVTALDSQDVKRWFKQNSKTVLRTINDAVRNGSHLGLSKLS
jgi:hypothetical protein